MVLSFTKIYLQLSALCFDITELQFFAVLYMELITCLCYLNFVQNLNECCGEVWELGLGYPFVFDVEFIESEEVSF